MRRFDLMTVCGLVLGLALVLIGIKLEGDLSAFWNPAGLLITLGGSFGAVMINYRFSEMSGLPGDAAGVCAARGEHPRSGTEVRGAGPKRAAKACWFGR